jgi:hypothetical protein
MIEKGDLRRPGERLLDYVLYWAWMGYPANADRLIAILYKRGTIDPGLLDAVARLSALKADVRDLDKLKSRAAPQYRTWLLQSLWIKALYLKQRRLTAQDAIWLKDFPPRMNREYFISFACMLGWCYLFSGMRQECAALLDVLTSEYSFLKQVRDLKKGYDSGYSGYLNPHYVAGRLRYSGNTLIKQFLYRCVSR